MYLVIGSQPSNLVTPVTTSSNPTPIWTTSPIFVRLHVFQDPFTREPQINETFHLLVSLIDDKFGPDEALGACVVKVMQVMKADGRKLKLRVGLKNDGMDTTIVMEGVAEIVLFGESDWRDPQTIKYQRSLRQLM
eukprot:c15618_g1_i1.p1 GENE.c15618_g1_i1~~c15618_g1_i1.p1  ORF type:complete len:135 (-),score=32.42 c15618_g1_i1:190-594(-)